MTKKTRTELPRHAELDSASGLLFSAFGRRIFHACPRERVFICAFNKTDVMSENKLKGVTCQAGIHLV
jgi:hypothetical protein